MPEAIERYLNSKEVAAMLNISPETLRKWRYSGKISYYVLGHRTVRFTAIEVQRLIRVGRFRAFKSTLANLRKYQIL